MNNEKDFTEEEKKILAEIDAESTAERERIRLVKQSVFKLSIPIKEYKYECVLCHKGFDKPKKIVPGHFIIEVALWLIFLFPGIIYSVWRLCSKKEICPFCKSENYIKK